jgi:nicotinate-nucleotide adenylyltransferase
MKKIGLLGGSFDPVHLAHIALANAAYRYADLDTVELIPAANPWQRGPLMATTRQRLDMLELAIGQNPGLAINPIEIDRGGKTYTLDTLQQLPQGPDYYWILGTDQLANFCSWRGWRDITRLAHLMVAQRPGSEPDAPEELAAHLEAIERPLLRLPFQPMPISASHIRRQLSAGASVEGMVDEKVAGYIRKHNLYRGHP